MRKLSVFILSFALLSQSWGWFQQPGVGARIDRAHPINSGLVGMWLFNEGGGRVYDISGNNNHGTPGASSIVWQIDEKGQCTYNPIGGLSNNGINLDREIIAMPVAGGEMTFLTWVKPAIVDNFHMMTGANSASRYFYGSTTFYLYDEDNSGWGTMTHTLTTGWHFVGFTVLSNGLWLKISWYVDGELIETDSGAVTTPHFNIDALMWNGNTGYEMEGHMAFAGLWDRVLSAEEVMALYHNSYIGIAYDPVTEYALIPRIAEEAAAPSNPPRQRRVIGGWQ